MATSELKFDIFAKDRASKVFDKVGHSSERAGSRMSKVARGFATFGGVAVKGLGLAAGAMGAVAVAGGLMGLKTAAAMEQAEIAFTTMLGSGKKARAFLDDLKDFAAKTPFEFPELQTAASSLISAGVEASKVIPIMTTLGDVTSGMGTGSEGVRRATVALQQMTAAGRITGEDLNQLRDAGIPVYDLLAKATGKSKAEVVKLAQAGKLGAKELGLMMKALESGKGLERFNGLMAKQSQSLSGLWSTFKDTVNMGLADAIKPLIPMLKDALPQAAAFAGRAISWIAAFLTGTLIPAFKSFSGFVRAEIVPRVQAIAGAFKRFATDAGPGTTSALQGARSAFESIRSAIASNMPQIRQIASVMRNFAIAVLPLLGPVLQQIARNIALTVRAAGFLWKVFIKVGQIALGVFGAIINGAAKAFGWVPGVGPKLKKAAAAFNVMRNNVNANLSRMAGDMSNIGANAAQGLASGIASRMHIPIAQARKMAQLVGQEAKLQLQERSPSKVFIKIGGHVAEGLSIGIGRGSIKAAAAAGRLAKVVTTAMQRGLVKIRERLSAYVTASKDMARSVADGVRGAFDISATGPTGSTFLGALGASVETAKKFATALAAARKNGVNANLLAQVAQAGPESGMDAATALSQSTKGEVGAINSQFAALGKYANQAGATAAGGMYAAQIASLKKQEALVEKALSRPLAVSLRGPNNQILVQWLLSAQRAHGGELPINAR